MDERLRSLLPHIRNIPDFPKPGIQFKDVTPLIGNGPAFRACVDLLAEHARSSGAELIVGIESRGFIFGAALADRLGLGFVPVRKPGKLPYKTTKETYSLEYGTDALEMHEDAVEGRRCLIVDDLLATGGTAAATARLVERCRGRVEGFLFVIELAFLKGRERLGTRRTDAIITY